MSHLNLYKKHGMLMINTKCWTPSRQYQYLGRSSGRAEAGPNRKLMHMASIEKCFTSDLFFKYVTLLEIFEPMIDFTQHYACEEIVDLIQKPEPSQATTASPVPTTPTTPNTTSQLTTTPITTPKRILQPCSVTHPEKRLRLKFDKGRA